ncbi:unnamed protein product [Sympodiomycopsis kandeliae]
MKFGKQLQSNQIPGWSAAYLDYKFLKKIINSLEKGRLGDAALFATGVRPEYEADSTSAQILPRLEGADELQAHKAAFFFKLERELEKINAFYLQKEAELRVRLKTLTDKRSLITAKRGAIAKLSKESPAFYALYEGFRYFEKDLGKLQQFIEINATGFRKILKKWDKRSKSQTKELYLARQVEVQPCFNREFIAELSDIAAANLVELENIAENNNGTQTHHNTNLNGQSNSNSNSVNSNSNTDGNTQSMSSSTPISPISPSIPDPSSSSAHLDFDLQDLLADLEENLSIAIKKARTASAADMIRVAQQNEDVTSVSRIVWRALLHSSPEAVRAAMEAQLPDFTFVDDINSRTCLHEAALAGNLTLVTAAIHHKINAGQRDIYGRAAISYAAMNGHADVCTFLLQQPGVDAATADLDGFSPLVLAVINGRTQVVRILLEYGVSVEPKEPTDLIPLCLASQAGHADITSLLLQRGAKITSNPEGLTPQALAAREGHVSCLRLLMQAKANPDAPEKGTLWTPLFFAAESGHLDCIQVVLDSGCKISALDEKGRNAIFYAAWKGHIDCLAVLLQAAEKEAQSKQSSSSSHRMDEDMVDGTSANGTTRKKSRPNGHDSAPLDDLDAELEADGIPSLSLPPPIIPFRTYGHNYLDKRSLVTISLTNSSVKLYKHQDSLGLDHFSASSVKLVMTSRPDASATYIPHNIVLPLVDDREVFSFQVEALDKLSIEWELKPTFGSKVIGKAVALPSSFEGMTDRKKFVLPLQDAYLKVVGEVNFEIDFVKPFDGVQLEIGGRVETYWKSLLPGTVSSGGLRMTPTGAGGEPSSLRSPSSTTNASTATPANASAAGVGLSNTPTSTIMGSIGSTSALVPSAGSASVVTASSLSGEYLRLAVQVTKDGVAVVYDSYTLPVPGLDVYIGSVTGQQFVHFGQSTNRLLDVEKARIAAGNSIGSWTKLLQDGRMTTLESLLSVLPPSIGIDLNILYPSTAEVRENPSLPKLELNYFVDTILHAVYRSGTTHHRDISRKILFTCKSPTICTALNWKQPNYAVFFTSDCGLNPQNTSLLLSFPPTTTTAAAVQDSTRVEPDSRRSSISEAVKFAKSNNLLGLAIDSILLNSVPELIQTIKASGLLLITIGNTAGQDEGPAALVDGVIQQGVLKCNTTQTNEGVFS